MIGNLFATGAHLSKVIGYVVFRFSENLSMTKINVTLQIESMRHVEKLVEY